MRTLAGVTATAATLFVLAAAPAGAGQPNVSCETNVPSNPPPGFSTPGSSTRRRSTPARTGTRRRTHTPCRSTTSRAAGGPADDPRRPLGRRESVQASDIVSCVRRKWLPDGSRNEESMP